MHCMSLTLIILRCCQLSASLAVLGLAAWASAAIMAAEECLYYDPYTLEAENCQHYPEPGQLAFLLFASLFGVLDVLVIGFLGLCIKKINHPIAATVVDALAVVFFFASGIACGVAFAGLTVVGDALVAVAFIAWALFVASLVLNVLRIVKGDNMGGGRHKEYNSQNPELMHM